MREITKIMIKKYALNKLKYDFMGYFFKNQEDLSFHHLIVPHRLSHAKGIGDGYVEWNGAILKQKTSHDYLHIIERYDRDMFKGITREMAEQNEQGYLNISNLTMIEDILRCFEREYCGTRTKKGNLLIKPEYTEQRLLKK